MKYINVRIFGEIWPDFKHPLWNILFPCTCLAGRYFMIMTYFTMQSLWHF